MKRAAIVAIVLIATVLALTEFGPASFCCGWYDLTVEIDRESANYVSRVWYIPAKGDLSDAVITNVDEYLRFMNHQDSVQPVILPVGFSWRESALGRTWGHVQEYSDVIVVLHHVDGSRETHRVAVPHRDDARRVVVSQLTVARRPESTG